MSGELEQKELTCLDVQRYHEDRLTSVIIHNDSEPMEDKTVTHKSERISETHKMHVNKSQLELQNLRSINNFSRQIKHKAYSPSLKISTSDKDTMIFSWQQEKNILSKKLFDFQQLTKNMESQIKALEEDKEKSASELRLALLDVQSLECEVKKLRKKILNDDAQMEPESNTPMDINSTENINGFSGRTKSFNCALEESSFSNLSKCAENKSLAIVNYIPTMEINVKEKNDWLCGYCGYSATHHSTIVKHLRSHSIERPFACLHCPSRFKYKNNLMYHLVGKHCKISKRELETGVSREAFICVFCNTLFEDRKACRSHIVKFHAEFVQENKFQ